jgi:hypothetical protein
MAKKAPCRLGASLRILLSPYWYVYDDETVLSSSVCLLSCPVLVAWGAGAFSGCWDFLNSNNPTVWLARCARRRAHSVYVTFYSLITVLSEHCPLKRSLFAKTT